MVTADEIAGVSIFADLGPVERERLSPGRGRHQARAGRVRGAPGRRARALRGARGPPRDRRARRRDRACRRRTGVGDLFGEVPIALGTTFPFGFRAAEPSRVMRIEAHDYHAIAASTPEVGVKLGTLARERIGGLQGIAAEPPPPRAIVVGHRWDPSCAELRRFLDRNQVTFRWITPDAPDAADAVGRPLAGGGGLPRHPGRRRQDRRAPATPPGRRAAGARHGGGGGGVRHRDRRRRARPASPPPSTGPRRG